MTDWSQQRAVVTGGATGIGFAAALALARLGAEVAVLQPHLDQAQQAAARLSQHARSIGVCADVRDPAAVRKAFATIRKELGYVNILVHSAAVTGQPALAPLLECPAEKVDQIVDVNLKGSIYCAQAAADQMRENGKGGAILLISSTGAFAAQEAASVYCATKAALVALARGMALEWAQHGIRVNAIAPGDILTEASASIVSGVPRPTKSQPPTCTRWEPRGTPAQIANAIAFLVSTEADFITGTTLVADGGITAR